MKSITPTLVKSLKPKQKRYSISSDNLQITVHPTGRVVFQSYTQIKGRYIRQPIATFPSNRIEKAQLEKVKQTYAEHYLDYMAGKLPDTPAEEARKQLDAKRAKQEQIRNTQQQEAEKQRLAEGGWRRYDSDESSEPEAARHEVAV